MTKVEKRKVEIICYGDHTDIYIDGVEQTGLLDIMFRHEAKGAPELTLTFTPFKWVK